MSQRMFYTSFIFVLLSYLGIFSLVSASPITKASDGLSKRSLGESQPLHITSRDTTTRFNEIGASFTLASAENKVGSAGTYPRLARLSDGGILSVSTVVNSGNERVLTVFRSDDNGVTFSQIGTIASSTGDLDNGFLLQLPSGTVLAAFRNHDLNANRVATYYRITVCSSTDGGRTWAFSAQAAEQAANGYNGLWEPFMRIGNDGAIQLTYSGELSQTNQETFRVLSRDEGKTWTTPTNLHLHGDQQLRDGMQGIVSTKDAGTGQNALVMVFEINDNTHVYLGTMTSYDDGNTWGNRDTIFRPANHNAGAPQIASIGNNLAVVFMTDEDRAVSELAWPNKADIKMIFSTQLRNGQATWTSQTFDLSGQSSYWPGIFQRDTNDVIAVYERGVPYGKVISAA
ncbi:glycoside hydrolase family 93 protein [Hypoxylon sp. FL1857]|nr:glycoside hydrolase family 93 protein [Hypoxylon sp. FL1857]